MTREEAIKILADLTDNLFLHTLEEQYKALHMAIKALSAEAEWIPCSERLPKVGEQVLCCDSQSRVFTSALTEIASNGMTFFGQHCKVVAWMPLPGPYREERKDYDYELATEQMEHYAMYEPTYNPEDGSM